MCCYSFHLLTRECAIKMKMKVKVKMKVTMKVTTVQCRAGGLFEMTTFLSWDGEWFDRV